MNDLTVPRVERIEAYLVRIPLVFPFETSFSVQTYREALILRLRSEGLSGWGECVAGSDPFYSNETNITARHVISDYLLPIMGNHFGKPFAFLIESFRHVRGHRMAKAALENALLDLEAKRRGVPLYTLLGGDARRIASGISLGIEKDPKRLLERIEAAVERKYGRIKIKIKRGHEIAPLEAVRGKFPDMKMMADANSDYSLDDISILKELDKFSLMMIEQPLAHEDIYFHSLLQKELETPVCLDESIHSLDDARTALELKSCRVINIKQGRVGGLLASRDIQDYCLQQSVPVWSGGMLETGIGRACNIHLQTLPGFTLPGDTSETSRYFAEEITDPPVVLDTDGMISIPPGPGIGVEVNGKRLKRFTVSEERLL